MPPSDLSGFNSKPAKLAPSPLTPLTDKDFITQFENLKLDDKQFDHTGHLRLAWLYLKNDNYENALSKILSGIKAYATHLGASNKFHFTLTTAILQLIQHRLMQCPAGNFDEFKQNNLDLFDKMLEIIHTYYSDTCLMSEQAKQTFVQPDLRPLPKNENESESVFNV